MHWMAIHPTKHSPTFWLPLLPLLRVEGEPLAEAKAVKLDQQLPPRLKPLPGAQEHRATAQGPAQQGGGGGEGGREEDPSPPRGRGTRSHRSEAYAAG